jgi:hypothetical protein
VSGCDGQALGSAHAALADLTSERVDVGAELIAQGHPVHVEQLQRT